VFRQLLTLTGNGIVKVIKDPGFPAERGRQGGKKEIEEKHLSFWSFCSFSFLSSVPGLLKEKPLLPFKKNYIKKKGEGGNEERCL
jgi:hypothetical protein